MLKNLEIAILEKFIQKGIAAKALGMHAGNLTKLINTPDDSINNIRNATIANLKNVFSEYNIDWILGKSDIKYNDAAHNAFKMGDFRKNKLSYNGKALGDISESEIDMFDEEGNTRFYEISPGVYRMKVPLIPETAKAGYFTGFADAEYVEDQEHIITTVYKYHKGRYKAFRVVGDSMDVDRRQTFVHGNIIIGREIKRDLWTSPFHTHRYPFYVFVTKTDGIIFKELISHDVEKGIVKLHSLNEDKSQYPDFEMNLEDVALIFNVVKRESEI